MKVGDHLEAYRGEAALERGGLAALHAMGGPGPALGAGISYREPEFPVAIEGERDGEYLARLRAYEQDQIRRASYNAKADAGCRSPENSYRYESIRHGQNIREARKAMRREHRRIYGPGLLPILGMAVICLIAAVALVP